MAAVLVEQLLLAPSARGRDVRRRYAGILGTESDSLIGPLFLLAGLLTAAYGPNKLGVALIGVGAILVGISVILNRFYYPQKRKRLGEITSAYVELLARRRDLSIEHT